MQARLEAAIVASDVELVKQLLLDGAAAYVNILMSEPDKERLNFNGSVVQMAPVVAALLICSTDGPRSTPCPGFTVARLLMEHGAKMQSDDLVDMRCSGPDLVKAALKHYGYGKCCSDADLCGFLEQWIALGFSVDSTCLSRRRRGHEPATCLAYHEASPRIACTDGCHHPYGGRLAGALRLSHTTVGRLSCLVCCDEPVHHLPVACIRLVTAHGADPWFTDFPQPAGAELDRYVDARDDTDRWLAGVMVARRAGQVLIHYVGWSCRWDVWLPCDSARLAPYGTRSGVQTASWGQNSYERLRLLDNTSHQDYSEGQYSSRAAADNVRAALMAMADGGREFRQRKWLVVHVLVSAAGLPRPCACLVLQLLFVDASCRLFE